jgi:hypothetical protein
VGDFDRQVDRQTQRPEEGEQGACQQQKRASQAATAVREILAEGVQLRPDKIAECDTESL